MDSNMNRMDSNMVDDAESDLKKFTYHESARICHAVVTDDEADEVRQNAAGERAWKAFAGLRASGLIDWVRGDDGHIVKCPGPSGRAFTVSAITTAGMLACEYLQGIPSDSPEAGGGLADH